MKILRTIGILALVAGLVLGSAGSALAKGPPDETPGGGLQSPGKRHGFFGTADSAVGYVVTLVTKQGLTVEVTLPATAKYMVPRETKGPVERDAFETILDGTVDGDITAIIGKRVAVLATNVVGEPPGPFSGEAVRLMLIPSPDSPPVHAHRVGVVEAFDPAASITIIARDGEPYTFAVNGATVYRPDTIAGLTGDALQTAIIGGCVTVVTKGDPKLGPVAKAVVLHEELPDWWTP